MAASYKDIAGPITLLCTFTLKPEHADRVAQHMVNINADQMRLAKEGKLPGLISMEGVRFGDSFASWEKYTDADAVERITTIRSKIFKDLSIPEAISELPSLLFFPSSSLPPPQNQ